MKAVFLAGGRGTRIAEESHVRPKPMIEIGGRPILWHIMKIYAHYGITDFVVCLGYKGYAIKEYFANYFLHASDITIDMSHNRTEYHTARAEPWRITLVDTGETTQTGGRIRRVREYLTPGEPFCLTYGDGLADVDIPASIEFHRKKGLLVTMTAVRQPARFGNAQIKDDVVVAFAEKPESQAAIVNGGFFVVSPPALDEIAGDATTWEDSVLHQLAAKSQLAAWRHDGFWQPMDTMREKELLEELWATGKAPWKIWD